MSREPWILPLPETSSITLIWWHVKCTASQNKWCNPSHKPKHIFNWTYFRFLFTVIHRSVVILLRKSKTDGAIQTNMIFMDPVWDSFPFCMRRLRTVQSQTGTKITRVGSATDRHGLSSFLGQSHVSAWKEMYGERYELIPVWVRPGLM